jgi:isopenicillin N synthase-like dioxygenase
MSFDHIPILSLSEARDPATKSHFLEQLRHALLEVGFLYLKDVGIPDELVQNVKQEGVAFFDLPEEEKYVLNIMTYMNSSHCRTHSSSCSKS